MTDIWLSAKKSLLIHFMVDFQANLGQPVPSVFFLQLFQRRTIGAKKHRFSYPIGCPTCQSVKPWNRIGKTAEEVNCFP